MRTEVLDDVVHRHLQVLKQCHLRTRLVVERYHLVENREVARLLDIRHCSEDEPAGVVVETAADVIIATLGERLVLMVAATVRELGRGDVDDTLAGTTWNLVYEAHQVLVGVAETHTTTDTALEERCRA